MKPVCVIVKNVNIFELSGLFSAWVDLLRFRVPGGRGVGGGQKKLLGCSLLG